MTGFKNNVLGGIAHLFQHIGEDISDEFKAALKILQPSIQALEDEIKTHGIDIVKAAAAAAATAASAGKASGKSNSDIGKDALAAAESAARDPWWRCSARHRDSAGH
jgi:hypothetical protein